MENIWRHDVVSVNSLMKAISQVFFLQTEFVDSPLTGFIMHQYSSLTILTMPGLPKILSNSGSVFSSAAIKPAFS